VCCSGARGSVRRRQSTKTRNAVNEGNAADKGEAGTAFFLRHVDVAERNRAMIRQICGREPPERFKRQTAHGGQFVLFPLFPPAPGQARPGNTRFAERNIAP